MELLNLDALIEVRREVKLGGQNYPVVDQTVGQMIDAVRLAKKVDENPNDVETILGAMIQTAKRLVPGAPHDLVESLKMRQLSALIEFASASDSEAVAGSEQEQSGDDQAEKTKP